MPPKWLFAMAMLAGSLAGITFLVIEYPGAFPDLSSAQALTAWVRDAGWIGPLAVIFLLVTAIIASPLPSAPIALAAGAVYGHTLGTLYVVIGATLGAIGAFSIARIVGRDLLRRWLGERLDMGLLGSQNALTTMVFVFRLLPFISFDIVSYAAGLSALTPLRFVLATLAGVVPVSFALTHMGGGLVSGEDDRILLATLGVGLLTGVPVVAEYIRRRRSKHRASASGQGDG